jgi:hypothetical protein
MGSGQLARLLDDGMGTGAVQSLEVVRQGLDGLAIELVGSLAHDGHPFTGGTGGEPR